MSFFKTKFGKRNTLVRISATWLVAFLLASLTFPGSANAARRIIQFAGIMGAETETPLGANQTYGFCQVLLVNLGTSIQIPRAVMFLGYDAFSLRTLWSTSSTSTNADQIVFRGTTGAGGDADCLNTELDRGDMCIFRYATNTVPIEGRYTPCAGRIVVDDKDPSVPGSMIAAGSITQFQEALSMGGTLSGAIYLSGTHVLWGAANLATHSLITSTSETDTGVSNMNIYCYKACLQYSVPMTADRCTEHCGGGYRGGRGLPGEWDPGNTLGLIHMPSEWNVAHSSPHPTPVPTAPTGAIRYANPHFVGGSVVETISGPMNQICSGNRSYWEREGDEFSHADGVDNHAIYLGNASYANAPPERLLCSHRHLKDDLFMRVGSSTAFTINGGAPF